MGRSSRLVSVLALALSWAGMAAAEDFTGAYLGLYGAAGNGEGAAAGTYAGYRFALSESTYLGAEADVLLPSGDTDYLAAGLGSIGYEFLPDTLAYGRAGFAFDSDESSFWVAGAGVEHAVSDGVSLRLGGDYYDDLESDANDWVAKAGVALSF